MSALRRFAFFDREPVWCPALSCLDLTCGTSGRGTVVLGDSDGHIVFVDRDFKATAVRAFKSRVNVLAQGRGNDYLVAIGDGIDVRPPAVRAAGRVAAVGARERLRKERDRERAARLQPGAVSGGKGGGTSGAPSGASGGGPSFWAPSSSTADDAGEDVDLGFALGLGVPLEVGGAQDSSSGGGAQATIKVWRLDKRHPVTGLPTLVRSTRLFVPASKQAEKAATALSMSEDCSQLAVGCADGTLLLLRSDWTRERGSGSAVKYQLLQEPQPLPAAAAAPSASSSGLSGLSGPNPEAVTFLAFSVQADPAAAAATAAAAAAAAAVVAAAAAAATSGGGGGDSGGGGGSATLSSIAAGARSLGKAAVSGTAATAAAATAVGAAAVRRGFSTAAAAAAGTGGAGSRRRGGGVGGGALNSSGEAGGRGGTSGGMLCLFHVSPSKTRSWFTTEVRPLGMGRGWSPSECCVLLDDCGAETGRACLSDTGELTLGNDAGVYFYSAEERRAAYAFGGRKQRVAFFRSYLIVVAEEGGGALTGAGGGDGGPRGQLQLGSRGGVGGGGGGPSASSSLQLSAAGGGGGGGVRAVLSIYDLRARFIAYSVTLAAGTGSASGAAAAVGAAPSSTAAPASGGGGGGIGIFARRNAAAGAASSGSGTAPSSLSALSAPSSSSTTAAAVASAVLPPAASASAVRFLFAEWGAVFVFVAVPPSGAGAFGSGGDAGARFGLPPAPSSSASSSGDASTAAGAAGSTAAAAAAAAALPLTVFSLTEKDTATKLETLCRMQLFDTAAAVAGASAFGGNRDAIVDIYRRHGDVLYSKGDYEGSVAQYIRTLDDGSSSGGGSGSSGATVEPSYVIRRFLDAARVPFLVSYLEALHSAGRAASEHTTLLLNAYTKLRQPDKLRAFIRGGGPAAASAPAAGDGSSSGGPANAPLTFDVRVAIGVLREAGCLEDAVYLAERHGEHDAYIQLLLEAGATAAPDTSASASSAAAAAAAAAGSSSLASSSVVTRPGGAVVASPVGAETAIAFIRRLVFAEAEAATRRYGRALLAAAPAHATALCCDLAAGLARAQPFVAPSTATPSTAAAAAAPGGDASGSSGSSRSLRPPPLPRVSSPDVLLPLFADSPQPLKAFCAFVVGKASSRELPPPSPLVWHSFIEVSLSAPPTAISTSTSALSAAIAEDSRRDAEVLSGILKDPSARYEPHTALALCQRAGYAPGCLYLYERLRMHAAVLAHYVDVADAAWAAGRLSEAKAARRELVRKAKAFADAPPGGGSSSSSGGGGGASSTSAAAAAAGGGGNDGNSDNSTGTTSSSGSGGTQFSSVSTDVSLWVPVLQYLTRTYMAPGSGAAAAAAASLPSASSSRAISTSAAVSSALTLLPPAATGSSGASATGTTATTATGAAAAPLVPLDDQDTLLTDVLRHVDRTGALQPLTVVSLLSANPAVPFGAVREFVVRRLGAEGAKLTEERRAVESLRADTLTMLDESRRLDTQPIVYQSRKCRGCGGDLELPSVHFPCGALLGEEHSFHAHCVLGDATAVGLGGNAGSGGGNPGGRRGGVNNNATTMTLECPVCASDQRTVREFRASLGGGPGGLSSRTGTALTESFFHELSQTSDGFAKCAEYLSKGLFDASALAVAAPATAT